MMNSNKRRSGVLVALCLMIFPMLAYADAHLRNTELLFNWPEGLNGIVSTVEEVTKTDGKKKSVTSFSRKARFTSTKHPEGLLVRFFDKEFKILRGNTTSENPLTIPTDVSLKQNNLLISSDGELIDMPDIGTELKVLNEKYQKDILRIYPDISDAERTKLLDDYASTFSKNYILDEYQRNWGLEVSQWSGLSLNMDKPVKLEDSLQYLAVGGAELPASGQYEFQGRALCPRHEDRYCVKVSYSAELSSESIERMNKMLATKFDIGKARNSADVLTIELTADPKTLLPYSLVKKHVSRSELGFFSKKWMVERKITTDFTYN